MCDVQGWEHHMAEHPGEQCIKQFRTCEGWGWRDSQKHGKVWSQETQVIQRTGNIQEAERVFQIHCGQAPL